MAFQLNAQIPLSAMGITVDPARAQAQAQALAVQRENALALNEQRQAIAEDRRIRAATARTDAERQAKGDAAIESFFQDYDPAKPPDPRKVSDLFRFAGPDRTKKLLDGLRDFQTADLTTQEGLRTSMTKRLVALEQLPKNMRAAAYQAITQDYIARGAVKAEEVPPWSDDLLPQLKAQLLGPQKPVAVAAGSSLVDPTTGQPVYTAPERKSFRPADVLLDGRPAKANFETSSGRYFVGDQDVTARVRPIPPAAAQNGEPLVAIMGPDGNPVYVPRSQAAGKRPANIREQGRQVTSGDANRLADLDTSLNDLATLTQTLTQTGAKAPTGAVAQFEAAIPKAITDLTGWGVGAKQKQAVIDRVKQVIGKALEGGVLRKEDEYKYEKILPTIGDTAAVVSSKLQGLQKAIAQRRATTLESLADAGYDVSRFQDSEGGRSAAGASDPLVVVAPNGKTYRFKTQAEADVFKKRAGIQ